MEAAALGANLIIFERLDCIPKVGKPPLFSVFAMKHRKEGEVTMEVAENMENSAATYPTWNVTVRDEVGDHTMEYMNLLGKCTYLYSTSRSNISLLHMHATIL